jgi:hypothetical protein
VRAGAAILPAELDGLPLMPLKTLCAVHGMGYSKAEKAPDLVARLRAKLCAAEGPRETCAEGPPTKKLKPEVRTTPPPRPPLPAPTHTPAPLTHTHATGRPHSRRVSD